MARGMPSTCINHTGVEAAIRCKQCGTPACSACKVSGRTGNFCSDACREKHEQFILRAQELERRRPTVGVLVRLRRMVVKLVVLVLVVLLFAALLTYLGVEVPFLSDQLRHYLDF